MGECRTLIPSRPGPDGRPVPVEVDDVGRAFLRFESGATGSIEANWLATGRKMQHDFEVYGSKGGLVFSQVLRWRWLVPHGFENILTLGFVLLMFHASDHFVPQSGILAVTVAGVVMGARPSHVDREIREFKDQLTLLVVALLFVLLSADISIEDIRALGRPGFIVVGVLILGVRPIGVWLSTLGSDLGGRERFFIAWLAPRGIVAGAVSSLTADSMTRAGVIHTQRAPVSSAPYPASMARFFSVSSGLTSTLAGFRPCSRT